MKYLLFLLLPLLALSFCSCKDEITTPNKPKQLFYKFIDTTLFKGDIYTSISQHQDTIVDNNGYLKVVNLPTINIHLKDGKMMIWHQAMFYQSEDNINYAATNGGFEAGIFEFASPYIFFTYAIEKEAQNKIYIKLADSDSTILFLIGVNVR